MGSAGGPVLLLLWVPLAGQVLATGSATPYCPPAAHSYVSPA